MSIEIDENFTRDIFVKKLKESTEEGRNLIPIVDFIFSDYGSDLFDRINRDFRSPFGPKAYDRRKLYLAISHASFYEIDHDLKKVSRLCRNDKIMEQLFGDKTPCNVTFDNFLNQCNPHILKTLSLCTVMELNDLQTLDFSRIYTDSTDAKINGSAHYKVSQKEIDGLELMNELNLLHNRSTKKIKNNRKKLIKYRDKCEDKDEIEIINHVLKNFKLYDKRLYDKLDTLKEYLKEVPDGYISVMFPEARFIKTKRGKYDFALLVQETMLKNGIILNSLVQSEPNDSKALEEIILDLKDTFKTLIDLQVMYGERSNYKEIYDALNYAIHVLDSGYFTDVNMEKAEYYGLNILIMPRSIAKKYNDKLKDRIPEDSEEFKKKFKKITLREMQRIFNGYICPYGINSKLIDIIPVNSKYNRLRQHLDEKYHEFRYVFETLCPLDCPYADICSKEHFEIVMTKLKNDMLNKFTVDELLEIYSERFGANEQIFGHYKRDKGMLKLAGSNKKAAQNHLYIKMINYNLHRKEELKGTAL